MSSWLALSIGNTISVSAKNRAFRTRLAIPWSDFHAFGVKITHRGNYHPLMRVLIVGCGYVGTALGVHLVKQGHEVFGLRRSAGMEVEHRDLGITPLVGDITRPETLAGLPNAYDWVVNCIASGGGGAEEYRRVYLQGTRNLIEWLSPKPPKKF